MSFAFLRRAAASWRGGATFDEVRQRLLRASAGTALGLCALTGVQAAYLKAKYARLPEAQGPVRGVAAWVQEALVRRATGAPLSPQAHQPPQPQPQQQVSSRCASSGGGGSSTTPPPAPPPPAAGAPRARKNILFVGDSLVTGVGCDAESGAKGPPLPRAVSEFVARQLRVDVTWTAIGETGGDVACLHSNLLPSVVAEVLAAREGGQAIDMVVLCCGLNDFKQAYSKPRRTASSFRLELSAFVDAIRHEVGLECAIVLPALPVAHAPVFAGLWPLQPLLAGVAALWDEQKEALQSSATRVSFVGAANLPEWWSRAIYWASDGIHPNNEGYRVWGEHIGTSIVRRALLQPGQA